MGGGEGAGATITRQLFERGHQRARRGSRKVIERSSREQKPFVHHGCELYICLDTYMLLYRAPCSLLPPVVKGFGESEFVVPAGAPIRFERAKRTLEYCTP